MGKQRQILLRLGADSDKIDITGRNCFHVAENEQMKSYVKTLLDMSSWKDDHLEKEHIYQPPLPSTPPPPLPYLPNSGESNIFTVLLTFTPLYFPQPLSHNLYCLTFLLFLTDNLSTHCVTQNPTYMIYWNIIQLMNP